MFHRGVLIQARSFSEHLARSILVYLNRAVETVQLIEQLDALAEEIRQADQRGEQLELTEDEATCSGALETNDSAVRVLGDETLRTIACELVQKARANATIDRVVKESVRNKLRAMV